MGERKLDWAGVCSPEKYYIFSVMNRERPDQTVAHDFAVKQMTDCF